MAGIGAATSEKDNDVDNDNLFLRLSIVPKVYYMSNLVSTDGT